MVITPSDKVYEAKDFSDTIKEELEENIDLN